MGEEYHCHIGPTRYGAGRAFIPIISIRWLIHDQGVFFHMSPSAIVVVDEDGSSLYQLGETRSLDALMEQVPGLADSLKEARCQINSRG